MIVRVGTGGEVSVEFGEFLDGELPALTRFAGVLTGNRQDAHDVLADALLTASARWNNIGDMQHPQAYVRRIVVTTFLAAQRKSRRRATTPTGDLAELDSGLPDAGRQVEDRDEVGRLIDRLPDRQRAAVVLRYYLDLDDRAIALALDCAPSTVRSLLWRALTTLRLTAITSKDPR